MAEISCADGAITVVDVVTGTGFVAAGIAPLVARVNLAELDARNVDLLGDVMALPLESDSSDAALARYVLTD